MSEEPEKIVELYHGEPRDMRDRNALCDQMTRCSGIMAQNFADDLAGYIVIGVGRKGDWSLGFGVSPDGLIGMRMLAGLGLVAIQNDMIAENAIKDALIRNGLVKP